MKPMSVGLREWRPELNVEPVVRIGVVLAEDAGRSVELQVPDSDYLLAPANSNGRIVKSSTLIARRDDRGVAVGVDNAAPHTAASWSISEMHRRHPSHRQGLLVKNVIAGR